MGGIYVVKPGSDSVFRVFVVVTLALAGLVCLFPMMYVVSVSLTPYEEYLRQGGIILFPRQATLFAYREYFGEPYLWDSFMITMGSTVAGTALNILATVLMAYPLSKPDLIFRKFFSMFVLIPMLLSGGMIPTYLVVKSFGLLNSIWAYIVPGLIWSYVLLITRTFFAQIDAGLYESARMDGASEWTVLFRIILPVSTPILATIGLMYGVGHWNEYFASRLYSTSPQMRTLQALLRDVLDRSTDMVADVIVPSRTLQMAGVVFSALPIILVYPFLQKYFTQGIMLGSIKG